MVIVESAGITDVGRKRKGNEDSLFMDDELALYVVADGMGGHQAGEVASSLVVETMGDYMRQFRENPDTEEPASGDNTFSKEANRLISGICLSNEVVHDLSNSKSSYRGMGSTVSAVCFTVDDTFIASNVGDSPIYLIRNGAIKTLSVPHTVIAEHMALHPNGPRRFGKAFSHMLTRAMGIEKIVRPDTCEDQCFKNDMLVIASDGLSDKVKPKEVLYVVKDRSPDKCCQMLVDMANERGGEDNITVIVLKVKAIKHEKTGIAGFFSRFVDGMKD
ncbi:protein phosphatase 2C domain-containing protein [Desulfonema magnum]|uniref:Phosphatase, PPM-type n=1 Tax=Desulfonema magnum TaxID=45655 RepID=A0A975BFB7_9BACT|nr:protein phosphatase 2C domain-containing protein [Desulfonema magnum]QTA84377.1 Phosphatase, PPM-type [Desulfonema magnum]